MTDPTVFKAIDALVVIVGALSACIGLYLQFLVEDRLPVLYSVGFYLAGVAVMSISFVPLLVVSPTVRTASVYLSVLTLIVIELAVLRHIYRKYGIRLPHIAVLRL